MFRQAESIDRTLSKCQPASSGTTVGVTYISSPSAVTTVYRCCKLRRTRFYDFNVWTEDKRIEKLRYIHRNPVTRGLLSKPEEWRWSSYRFYALAEEGPVSIGKHARTG